MFLIDILVHKTFRAEGSRSQHEEKLLIKGIVIRILFSFWVINSTEAKRPDDSTWVHWLYDTITSTELAFHERIVIVFVTCVLPHYKVHNVSSPAESAIVQKHVVRATPKANCLFEMANFLCSRAVSFVIRVMDVIQIQLQRFLHTCAYMNYSRIFFFSSFFCNYFFMFFFGFRHFSILIGIFCQLLTHVLAEFIDKLKSFHRSPLSSQLFSSLVRHVYNSKYPMKLHRLRLSWV